jgi:hypothetical protein
MFNVFTIYQSRGFDEYLSVSRQRLGNKTYWEGKFRERF